MKHFLLFIFLIPFIAPAALPSRQAPDPDSTEAFVMPSLTRAWVPSDFINVFEYILEKEKNSNYVLDKHKESALFAKLTRFENYSFLESPANDWSTKAMLVPKIINLLNRQASLYMSKGFDVNRVIIYEEELADLMLILIQLTSSVYRSADLFFKDASNLTPIQQEGLQMMKNGLVGMVNGILYTIEKEYKLYSASSICRLSEMGSIFYGTHREMMPEDVVYEYDTRILNIKKAHKLPCVKTAFSKIVFPAG